MYLSYTLDEKSANMLERKVQVPSVFRKVLHHVTLYYNPPKNKLDQLYKEFSSNIVVKAGGYYQDNNCIAILVSVNDQVERLPSFRGKYHITHSLANGIKPVYSNTLVDSAELILFDEPILITGKIELLK